MVRKTLKEVGQEIKGKEKLREEAKEKIKEVGEMMVETPTEVYEIGRRCLKGVFDFLASRLGKKWKLEEKELEELTNSYIGLLNKYVPKILAKFSVEADAIICTSFIILKRVAR